MTEKKHDKTTASACGELDSGSAKSSEAFDAYLTAIFPPLGSEDEMPAVHGNVDEFESATVAEKANVLDNPLGAESTDADFAVSESSEERFIELVRLYCVEGEHQVSRNSLDSHGSCSYPSDNTANRITAIAQSLMCGAVGAATALALEKLIS